MADLNQFLNKDLTAGDIAHSTGYGAIAGGGGAGGLSMEQRHKLMSQPRVVGAYQYSRLGRQGSAMKARTADQSRGGGRAYDASSNSFSDESSSTYGSNRQSGGLDTQQVDTRSVEKREHFIEPPSRNYDKYG